MAIKYNAPLKPLNPPKLGYNGYVGFTPNRIERVPAGTTLKGWDDLDCKPLKEDLMIEHDVEIVVRDGTKLYADLYFPADLKPGQKCPYIVGWSPYGKKYSAVKMLPVTRWKCGIVPSDLSGFEKFEGADPAEFCPRGYAIASVDERGAGHSEGNVELMGQKTAEDGYDVIEWLAKRPECNGKVGMAGNSALAISQYWIASLKPPSLAAIAPWEGLSDLYRDQFCRGGQFSISNFNLISSIIIRGFGKIEDFDACFKKFPYATAPFWQDKRVDMTKIDIPTYLVGSDVTSLHTMGTLHAWKGIQTEKKWMRWGAHQEWFDLYANRTNEFDSVEDLAKFFDRFLKDINNDWETATPKVRMSLLRMGDNEAIENIEIPDWPLPNTSYDEYHLTPDGKLSTSPSQTSGIVSYDSLDVNSKASFSITFDKRTVLCGLPKAHLFMSCDDHNDMAVFIELRKLDAAVELVFSQYSFSSTHQLNPIFGQHVQVPMERRWIKKYSDIPPEDHAGVVIYPGSLGCLRASRRAIDRERSLHPQFPFHPHSHDDWVEPGQVVELEIGIWHCGVLWEAGETLRADITGTSPNYPELREDGSNSNIGTHKVHIGPEYPSRVILPVIPDMKLPAY
ncbi:hypothetical protein OIO90_001765 [Microbotryomycetes sp. JL221]|nr:hypothetical protein OIO90_001765 [Microbotryomycetes sp. JL221]